MTVEEWRQIPSFPDYEASSLGRIRRIEPSPWGVNYINSDRTFTPSVSKKGYLRVCMRRNGKQVVKDVHLLISEAFLGPTPAGLTVNHKDGVKANNAVDNLEFATISEQQLHAHRLGLRVWDKGEDHTNAKLSESDVRTIMALEGKFTQREIARRFGVASVTVNAIYRGRLWSHLTGRKVA